MDRGIIAPIVLWVFLTLKLIFGIELPNEYADMTIDAVLAVGAAVASAIDIKKNRKSKE